MPARLRMISIILSYSAGIFLEPSPRQPLTPRLVRKPDKSFLQALSGMILGSSGAYTVGPQVLSLDENEQLNCSKLLYFIVFPYSVDK